MYCVADVFAVRFFTPANGRGAPIVTESGQVYRLNRASVPKKHRVRKVCNIFSSSGGGAAGLYFNAVNALYFFAFGFTVVFAGTACDAVFAFPSVSDSIAPVVNDFRKCDILCLLGKRRIFKGCGISSKTVCFFRCGGYLRVSCGYGFGFNMACKVSADALCGAIIAV